MTQENVQEKVNNVVENVQNEQVTQQEEPKEHKREERLFRRDEVAKIVNTETQKVKNEMLAEIESQKAKLAQNSGNTSLGGINQLSEDELQKKIADAAEKEANRRVSLELATKVYNELGSKLLSSQKKYDDYEDQVKDLELAKIGEFNPNFIFLLNELDNAGDVAYDLAKNPSKLPSILNLSMGSPHLARKELNKLSTSIKNNEDALKKSSNRPSDPLSQIKPTITSMDSGSVSISDLRKSPKLRA